jgi:hypothetical protein
MPSLIASRVSSFCVLQSVAQFVYVSVPSGSIVMDTWRGSLNCLALNDFRFALIGALNLRVLDDYPRFVEYGFECGKASVPFETASFRVYGPVFVHCQEYFSLHCFFTVPNR